MAKVIGRDNYDRDYNNGQSEIVAGENLSIAEAMTLASKLNKDAGVGEYHTPIYYVVKADDYKLYVFEGY